MTLGDNELIFQLHAKKNIAFHLESLCKIGKFHQGIDEADKLHMLSGV